MSGILAALAGIKTAIATAVDEYFNRVTLLLPGNGTNGAQNNTFLDSSSNTFSITRNGNTTQGTFSPFSQTGWSNSCPTAGTDYINCGSQTAYAFGTGKYTIEFFVFLTTAGSTDSVFVSIEATTTGWYVSRKGNAGVALVIRGAGDVLATTAYQIPLNQWTHVVITRNSTATNDTRIFVNGVLAVAGTDANNWTSTGALNLMRAGVAGYNAAGFISNVRLIKGSIPTSYQTTSTTAGTTVFTSPSDALTTTSQGATSTDVSLLTCQSNRFVDNSNNGFAITLNGTPSVQAFSPFAPTAAYSAATNGGSGYFDGTGDCLALSYNAALVSGGTTNAFTVDFWYYLSSSFTNGCRLLSFSDDGGATGWDLWCDTANILYMNNGGTSGGNQRSFGAGSLNKNEWTYIRLVSDGTNFSAYRNGSRIYTIAGGFATSTASNLPTIGARRNSTGTISDSTLGYISNVRVVKGGALNSPSDTTISIPTAPFTTTVSAGTANLLLNFTNAGITDATAKNVLETVGNAQISTTQSKFGGSSMYFDGTGDALIIPRNNWFIPLANTDFTFECWVYLTATPPTSSAQLFGAGEYGSDADFAVLINSSLQLGIYFQSASTTYSNTTNLLTLNTWYHVAVSRSGTAANNLKVFVNGNGVSFSVNNTLLGTGSRNFSIGADQDGNESNLTGYIDDLRFTLGVGRYTANFTAPTAALPLQ